MEALGGRIVSFTWFWDDAHSGLFPALWVVTSLDAGMNQVGDPAWGGGLHPFLDLPYVAYVTWCRVVHSVHEKVSHQGITEWWEVALGLWWRVI